MDHNIAVETMVLAYMVNHPGLYAKLAHYPADIFFDPHHQAWFDAIRDCYSETGECDTVAIRTRLFNEGHDAAFNEKLGTILGSTAVATSLDTHIDSLLDSYHLRKIKSYAVEVSHTKKFGDAHLLMTKAINETIAGCGDTGASVADMAKDESALLTVGKVTPTGFLGLDKVIRGFGDNDFIVIGGHAKDGKTTAAVQLTFDMSRADPTVYYSLEMKRHEILQKIVCRKANVCYDNLATGKMSDAEKARVSQAIEIFKTGAYKFEIVDGLDHIDAILADAKVKMMSKGVKRIVVDYLQLCGATRERGMSRYEVIGSISRKLKLFANNENVNTVALSQLNGDKNDKPSLSSFRESGNIGQDCNLAMCVWYDPKDQQRKFVLLPGRRCPEADIAVDLRGEYSEFVDRSIPHVAQWHETERP